MAGPASVELCSELPAHYGRLFRLAERDPRRAVGVACQWHAAATASSDAAFAAYAYGYTLCRWERLAKAGQLLDDAVTSLNALGYTRVALHAGRVRLYARLLQGGGADHAAEWAAVADHYAAWGDHLCAARARFGQIIQLNQQGLAADALQLVQGLWAQVKADGTDADQAWLARLAGVTAVNLGELEAAQAHFERALFLFTRLGYRAEIAKTMIERSKIYERRGNLDQCIGELEQAHRLVRRIDLPLRVAFCTKNLGWYTALQGDYDRGIWLSLEAHDQLSGLGQRDAVADCDLNLGNIAYFAGLPELALAAYQRAERVYRDLGRRRMGLICHRNQAMALRLHRQPAEALQLLDALIPEAQQLGERLELAECIDARGQVLADLGRSQEALQAFEQSEQQFRTLGNRVGEGLGLLGQGWLHLEQGRLTHAARCFTTARPLLHEQDIHLWRVDHGLGRCAELRGACDAARTLYRAACLTVGRLRQRLANEHASSGLFAQARRLIDDSIRLASQQGDTADVLDLAELQRSVALTAALRANFVETAAASAEALEPALDAPLSGYLETRLRDRRRRPLDESDLLAPLELPRLRAGFTRAFPAGWTLLVYVPSGEQLHIVTLSAVGLDLTVTPLDARLRWLLERAAAPRFRWLTYLGAEPADVEGAVHWPILDELGARLLPTTALAPLRPDHRLLIVAGSTLHGLPWPALRVEGRWLVERATLQLLPGLHHWEELARRRREGNAALSIGIADFAERAPDLPGVATSLTIVAQRWPGAVRSLDRAGVKSLLTMAAAGELRSYGLIHLATHGQLTPSSGLLAHLKLADGDLFYDEVTRLNLASALVVLAACEGAAAEVLPGEEVLSLSRALLVAGASDVIASLWQLYDHVAPPLLDLLYAGLAAGLDAPTALAGAQRSWLALSHVDLDLAEVGSAPLAWAGLCAIGAGTAVFVWEGHSTDAGPLPAAARGPG